ncbi:Para-hydroxybenzoate--polyprenyltransferase, mitochondrial precursor (PHB:polyprenyltransferase) [Lobaria immixta]|nr:Para-hydroxybenzoate--polyprenyltransferase, mitochondrial precursor (PHB:polyprenyltransferase) [Lobaria immixta]
MNPKVWNAQASISGSDAAPDSLPDLSFYTAPSGRLMSSLPISLIPYAELMRLHKPAGYYAFYIPHLIGTLYASVLMTPIPSLLHLLRANILLIVGSLFLRGAACTWNDTLDAPLDRLVARCRYRPVARGAVSPLAANIFAMIQSVFGAIILYQLPPTCYPPATILVMTIGIYPLAKRITNYPQALLGFSLAVGQFVGAASMGMDLLQLTRREVIAAMGCLYVSNIVNAVIYDAVYAHQDLKDDLKAGVKSVAVAWQDYTKPVLCLLSTAEIILLGAAGYLMRMGPIYFASSVFGTAAVLFSMIWKVRLEIPSSCWSWFKWTIWLTGGTISGGLLAEYLVVTISAVVH